MASSGVEWQALIWVVTSVRFCACVAMTLCYGVKCGAGGNVLVASRVQARRAWRLRRQHALHVYDGASVAQMHWPADHAAPMLQWLCTGSESAPERPMLKLCSPLACASHAAVQALQHCVCEAGRGCSRAGAQARWHSAGHTCR